MSSFFGPRRDIQPGMHFKMHKNGYMTTVKIIKGEKGRGWLVEVQDEPVKGTRVWTSAVWLIDADVLFT